MFFIREYSLHVNYSKKQHNFSAMVFTAQISDGT